MGGRREKVKEEIRIGKKGGQSPVRIEELMRPSDRSRFGFVTTQRQIETYAEDVARQFRPLKIVLFGSYAYGNPTKDSDVDLMVVVPKDSSGVRNRERAMAIRSAIPKSFPLDLLVKDPEDISWRLEEGDCFLQDVFSKGRVLYEKADR
jgi:predicted nucleotidyltransferase